MLAVVRISEDSPPLDASTNNMIPTTGNIDA